MQPLESSLVFCLVGVIATMAWGCEDTTGVTPPPDAAIADAGTGPADIPWLATGTPDLVPSPERSCPDGFRQTRTDTGILNCRAYAESGPETCANGSAHFPGSVGCERIGTDCPADGWPTDLPTDRTVVYVRAGAIGGRGSIASPHGTIARALGAAPAGAVIAVAAGTYNAPVEPQRDVTILGACPLETILTYDVVSETTTVIGGFAPVTFGIENITIIGDGSMGVFVQGGASVHLTNVIIDHAAGFGVYATDAGTTVDLDHVLIHDVTRFPSGAGGIGAQYIEGAGGTLSHVASVANEDGHVILAEGGTVTITRFAGLGTAGGGRARGRAPRWWFKTWPPPSSRSRLSGETKAAES